MDFVSHAPEKVQTVPSSRAKSEHFHQLHFIAGGEQVIVVTHFLVKFDTNSIKHSHIGRRLQVVEELCFKADGFCRQFYIDVVCIGRSRNTVLVSYLRLINLGLCVEHIVGNRRYRIDQPEMGRTGRHVQEVLRLENRNGKRRTYPRCQWGQGERNPEDGRERQSGVEI